MSKLNDQEYEVTRAIDQGIFDNIDIAHTSMQFTDPELPKGGSYSRVVRAYDYLLLLRKYEELAK